MCLIHLAVIINYKLVPRIDMKLNFVLDISPYLCQLQLKRSILLPTHVKL